MNNDGGGDMTNVYPRGSMSPEPSGEGDMVPEGTHSSCLTHQSYSFFMSYFYKKFRIDETYINTFSVIFSVVLYLYKTINNYLILKVRESNHSCVKCSYGIEKSNYIFDRIFYTECSLVLEIFVAYFKMYYFDLSILNLIQFFHS